jgi:endo-1,4-beta-D-glucanase Y
VHTLRTIIAIMLLAALPAGAVRAGGRGDVSWPLWNAYAAVFVRDGRVVDPQTGDRTTSEGQAYGMFFALVADDRVRFDALLAWTNDNLAASGLGPRLPAWDWGRLPGGSWGVIDQNSASDADLWMAYALVEAGRLWAEPRYTALGKAMLSRIAQVEVSDLPGLGPVLLPGAVGFHPAPAVWVLNPSYMPLPVLMRLAQVDPAGPWAAMAKALPALLARSAMHGFAMDWVSYSPQNGFVAAAAATAVAGGSYDAIRVYLWAGMSGAGMSGNASVLRAVPGMRTYLQTHKVALERVNADGKVVSAAGAIGFGAALLPYLDALGETQLRDSQLRLLAAQLDPVTHLYGRPARYYDQNLSMFGMGWMERRFRFGPRGELEVPWR